MQFWGGDIPHTLFFFDALFFSKGFNRYKGVWGVYYTASTTSTTSTTLSKLVFVRFAGANNFLFFKKKKDRKDRKARHLKLLINNSTIFFLSWRLICTVEQVKLASPPFGFLIYSRLR
jgi:hypothetical protein